MAYASTENRARYIIRASFSQEQMTHLPGESRIIYHSEDNRQEKTFEALVRTGGYDLSYPQSRGKLFYRDL